MSINISDLPPKAQEQVAIKLAILEARRRKKAPQKPPAQDKENKYHAEKVEVISDDGTPFTFASRKEYERYQNLVLMQKGGQISDLRLQVTYMLVPAQIRDDGTREKPVFYVADFVYQKDGKPVIEDVKGFKNTSSAAYRVFVLKRKLMKYLLGLEIQEV